jgi:carboxylesterase type B
MNFVRLAVRLLLLLSVTTCFAWIQVAATSGQTRSVNVNIPGLGYIQGLRHHLDLSVPDKDVDVFLGIPFAEPPLGPLRFRPPQTFKANWTHDDPFQANLLPAACHQMTDTKLERRIVDDWNPNTNVSEDCLYLNVWRPSTAATAVGSAAKTVMVWIYGGGFHSGSSSLSMYDGSVMSLKGDVIVVSMQYRVGVLGFLTLDDESAPGNVGLLDQQLALQWVHDHIAAFGGDPGRVTLFGESAGAVSVSYHLLSPGSDKLFRSAIMQSAVANVPWGLVGRDKAKKNVLHLAELVGCPTKSRRHREVLDCMRQKDAALLTSEQWRIDIDGPAVGMAYGPTVDGGGGTGNGSSFLSRPPVDLLRQGQFQRKNILLGVTSDEGSYFLFYLFPKQFHVSDADGQGNMTAADYRKLVEQLDIRVGSSSGAASDAQALTGAVLDAVAFEYATPCSFGDQAKPSYFDALDDLLGDVQFKCPVVDFSLTYAQLSESVGGGGGAAAEGPTHSVYVYEFEHRTSASLFPKWAGKALHGYEIDHVFGLPLHPDYRSKYTDKERDLSRTIISYWTNFAKTGDPNRNDKPSSSPGNLSTWPKFTTDRRQVLVLDAKAHLQTKSGIRDRECEFMTKIVPQLLTAITNSGHGIVSTATGSFVASTFLALLSILFIAAAAN